MMKNYKKSWIIWLINGFKKKSRNKWIFFFSQESKNLETPSEESQSNQDGTEYVCRDHQEYIQNDGSNCSSGEYPSPNQTWFTIFNAYSSTYTNSITNYAKNQYSNLIKFTISTITGQSCRCKPSISWTHVLILLVNCYIFLSCVEKFTGLFKTIVEK